MMLGVNVKKKNGYADVIGSCCLTSRSWDEWLYHEGFKSFHYFGGPSNEVGGPFNEVKSDRRKGTQNFRCNEESV